MFSLVYPTLLINTNLFTDQKKKEKRDTEVALRVASKRVDRIRDSYECGLLLLGPLVIMWLVGKRS